MKARIAILTLFTLTVLQNVSAFAQCAMCQSTVSSDREGGSTNAESLNTGILYLMAIPYLILMTGAYLFFKKQVDAKLLYWKKKYFPGKAAGQG